MIEINNLIKKYSDQTVLNANSLDIPSGQTFGLIGNNGAGNTTLFSCLLDLIKPTEGKVLNNGVDVSKSEDWNSFTTAFLDDYHEFDNRTVKIGDSTYSWPKHSLYNTSEASERLIKTHQDLGTIAYVVIKNDSVFYEQYYQGYSDRSNTNSFSMVKSMVSGLLGKSIMNGTIESLDQPVGDFFPEFSEGLAAKMTVGDLSSMSSGTNWDENYYSPLSITTRAYFDDRLRDVILNLKVVDTPG